MKVHAKAVQWQRNPRTIPFRIDADQPGSPTATAPATFVQTPVVPENVLGRLIVTGAIVVGLAIAWVGLVKPAIRDAARTAVRDIAPSVSTAVSPSVQPGDTVDTSVGNNTPKGDATTIALPSSVPQGQTGANEYTVPAGKKLRVTDIIVQNPNADQGTLVVSVNGNGLLTYNLSQLFGDIDQALVTPIELQSGQKLTVNVTCDGVGNLTANACKPNVLVSGLLVNP
jgi:hypothetical protein